MIIFFLVAIERLLRSFFFEENRREIEMSLVELLEIC
jgi:hypothetical protein